MNNWKIGGITMSEKNIKLEYETIGVKEQRDLIEATRDLSRAMTKEEYFSVMLIYQKVVDRLVKEAENQGIEI